MMRVLKNTWLWFGLTVIVAAAGYFWLVASQPALPSLEGGQDSRPGSIELSSSPTGAEVYLDGSDLKQTTPATIDGVTAGKHSLKLTLSGYQDSTQQVIVAPGHPAQVQTELTAQ
jgi:hypothetical protein